MSHPIIIQGGMGAGVSNWRLARAVSRLGQMGVVAGTALDVILARRLQGGDPVASPTGFPFKVARLDGTLSEPEIYSARQRACDLGYLRRPYRKPEGTLGYRCPAEPEDHYVAKGGERAETRGRKCVCNGLLSTIGRGQIQPGGYREPALLTAGDDVAGLARFLPTKRDSYSAADVIRHLLGES